MIPQAPFIRVTCLICLAAATSPEARALVNGELVSPQEQERLGLVEIGSCSGALLTNRFVVTASHCVYDRDAKKNKFEKPSDVVVRAVWGREGYGQERSALRIEPFKSPDIAVIKLDVPFQVNGGLRGFRQQVWAGEPFTRMNPRQHTLEIYGLGLYEFARDAATPSHMDGKYRVGKAGVGDIDPLYFDVVTNDQRIGGMDSGGPSFVRLPSGPVLLGVHANCSSFSTVPGKIFDQSWQWVMSSGQCTDAPIWTVWPKIQQLMAEQEIDPNFYYRLRTQFLGLNKSLDVINGGPNDNMTRFESYHDRAGQFWRFTPVGEGWYRLSTWFRGPEMCLDVYNGGPNDNQPHLTTCDAKLSGQYWFVHSTPDMPPLTTDGFFAKLFTEFRGPGMCLDVYNGGTNDQQPYLDECLRRSGQQWFVSKTDKRAEPVGLKPVRGAWSAFATDGRGHWGLAAHRGKLNLARTSALKACGGSEKGCNVFWTTSHRCVAYAESRAGGYWYGAGGGNSETDAERNAIHFCQSGAAPPNSCKARGAQCR